MKKKKSVGILLSLFMIISMLFQGLGGTIVHAEAQVVDATITDFRIEKPQGTPVSELNKNDSFYIAMDWKVQDPNAILHSGDYFDIKLPDNLRFPPSYSQSDFPLTDANGNVIANAHVNPGANNSAGGTIRVTFNDGINNKYNVHGTIYLGALFNKNVTKDNEVNKFEVSVNGKIISTGVKVIKNGLPSDHILGKFGERVVVNEQVTNQVRWYSTINYRKSDLKNCVISDELTGDTTYIPSTFKLTEVEYNDEGGVIKTIANVDISGKLSFGPGNKSFTLNLGDAGKKQYRLVYDTTYTANTVIKNKIKIAYDGGSKETSATFKDSTAGGTAGGDLASKIKLTKVDAEDNNTVLANAVFIVTSPDGSTFELTTGADGTVISETLKQGTYKVKEKTAPVGYKLSDQEYTLEVTPTGGALKTITNEPLKIAVSVEKKWIGKEADSVTVHLYADGQDTNKSIVLNKNNNWKHTFDGLRQYTPDGQEIKYTVKEDVLTGYTSNVTGSQKDGYIITNTNTETTSVKVNKTWVGPKKDSVTVKLLADGQDANKTLVLNERNQWRGSFDGLKKYNDNGTEIKYTIEEVKIDNYESTITGSQKDGYTITNTNTEKIDIKVTKKWIGPKGRSVTIRLLADEQAAVRNVLVLDESNQWTGSFTGLAKYHPDGSEIKYTIEEVKIDNYESNITGDASNGYIITNTNTETTSVKINKTWVGPKKDSVTVKLLADGQATNKTLILNEANQWSGSFDNLAKYNPDGSEIKYTIEEVKIDNYESKITGSQKDGYTITNTNTEKISVEVIKKWIGKEREAIKVKLYGDGKEIEEVTITKATGWRHSFMNLKKYNDDGSEIKYTIAEEAIEGYSSEISGDASQGYVITNREKPTKPKTGDESKIGMYLGMVGLSLLGILYIKKEELI